MFVGVKCLLHPAFVMRIDRLLIVPIVKACMECRRGSWVLDQRRFRPIYYFKGIRWVIQIRHPNEPPLLLNKLVKILPFIFSLILAKSLHPQIKGIHGPRHRIDECRLILINEAINLLSIFLDLLALPYLQRIRPLFGRFRNYFLPEFFSLFADQPIMNSLLVHKLLDLGALLLSLIKRPGVVCFLLIFLLSVLFWSLIAHFLIFGGLC